MKAVFALLLYVIVAVHFIHAKATPKQSRAEIDFAQPLKMAGDARSTRSKRAHCIPNPICVRRGKVVHCTVKVC
ncbi:unnamed protein product [Cylicocyclus nassatus]|uniref:Uncharacterized protein n=1 Tax=Cylicocyclus nassatus TaxID=53992 RepID=A0AA36GND4_CYLNA|nr:unnamed protein product [Cylicocyclus nassatus]